MADSQLQGVTVLVTRPEHQQAAFIEQLHALQANTVSFPCLDIRWIDDDATIKLRHLSEGQIIIFTSPNAVQAAHHFMPMPWGKSGAAHSPDSRYTVLAIGPGTADMLDSFGMSVSRAPVAPYNSESLLASEELSDPNLQKVSIIKGRGGRQYLENYLRKTAECVEIIEVYERSRPKVAQKTLDTVFLLSALDIVTITSNEALQNLVDLVDNPLTGRHKERLLQLPLIVNSQRGAQLARDLYFQSHIIVASSAGDLGQVEAIKLWNSSYRFKL